MITTTAEGRYIIGDDQELTADLLAEYVARHDVDAQELAPLMDAYKGDYAIFYLPAKEVYKPDNRIGVGFARYIVETFEGFFMGIPVQISADDERVNEYIHYQGRYVDQDDTNAELSRLVSIYGWAYEMYYVDEFGQIGTTYLSPTDAFMIFDESILERPRYFVRTYTDAQGTRRGSVSDAHVVRYFKIDGGVVFDADERVHGFSDVPATEYIMNNTRQSLIAPVMSMIDAYNKAISEKANDVDYFADAYLKILGAKLRDEDLRTIRDDRIINFAGMHDGNLVVEFLQKPDGDSTQEHLIDRLERLIFQISMVANISDETFGTASGQALKFKLHAMSSLAKTKERKFVSGMNRRYGVIFTNPVTGLPADGWTGIKYKFTQNIPSNLLDEANTAKALAGIVSRETQMRALSVVDDPQAELEKIIKEDQEYLMGGYPDERTGTDEGADE